MPKARKHRGFARGVMPSSWRNASLDEYDGVGDVCESIVRACMLGPVPTSEPVAHMRGSATWVALRATCRWARRLVDETIDQSVAEMQRICRADKTPNLPRWLYLHGHAERAIFAQIVAKPQDGPLCSMALPLGERSFSFARALLVAVASRTCMFCGTSLVVLQRIVTAKVRLGIRTFGVHCCAQCYDDRTVVVETLRYKSVELYTGRASKACLGAYEGRPYRGPMWIAQQIEKGEIPSMLVTSLCRDAAKRCGLPTTKLTSSAGQVHLAWSGDGGAMDQRGCMFPPAHRVSRAEIAARTEQGVAWALRRRKQATDAYVRSVAGRVGAQEIEAEHVDREELLARLDLWMAVCGKSTLPWTSLPSLLADYPSVATSRYMRTLLQERPGGGRTETRPRYIWMHMTGALWMLGCAHTSIRGAEVQQLSPETVEDVMSCLCLLPVIVGSRPAQWPNVGPIGSSPFDHADVGRQLEMILRRNADALRLRKMFGRAPYDRQSDAIRRSSLS